MSLFIREISTLYSLRTEVQSRMRIFHVRLWLTFTFFYRWNCVLRSCNTVIEPVDEDIDEGLSQKERKTLQTYELLIPAGAPGGSGYTDPVIRFLVPLATKEN
jgi:hypothetical protein